MQEYKHGEKVRRWVWGYRYTENPKWKISNFYQERYIIVFTGERRYYGEPYRYRMDPIAGTGGWRCGSWSKYKRNKGSGKCWKREWYAARCDAKNVFEEYGITFKNSNQIPYKHGHNDDRSWKRSKKKFQWM